MLISQKTGSRFKSILIDLSNLTIQSNKMFFSGEKCKVLHVGRKIQINRYKMGFLA